MWADTNVREESERHTQTNSPTAANLLPGEMQHKVAFHQDLHYLLRYEQSLGTEIHHYIEILTGQKYKMNNSILIVCYMYGIIHLNGKGY